MAGRRQNLAIPLLIFEIPADKKEQDLSVSRTVYAN